jgi:hypothetical protein
MVYICLGKVAGQAISCLLYDVVQLVDSLRRFGVTCFLNLFSLKSEAGSPSKKLVPVY